MGNKQTNIREKVKNKKQEKLKKLNQTSNIYMDKEQMKESVSTTSSINLFHQKPKHLILNGVDLSKDIRIDYSVADTQLNTLASKRQNDLEYRGPIDEIKRQDCQKVEKLYNSALVSSNKVKKQ
jgi:hypothetical protein